MGRKGGGIPTSPAKHRPHTNGAAIDLNKLTGHQPSKYIDVILYSSMRGLTWGWLGRRPSTLAYS